MIYLVCNEEDQHVAKKEYKYTMMNLCYFFCIYHLHSNKYQGKFVKRSVDVYGLLLGKNK